MQNTTITDAQSHTPVLIANEIFSEDEVKFILNSTLTCITNSRTFNMIAKCTTLMIVNKLPKHDYQVIVGVRYMFEWYNTNFLPYAEFTVGDIHFFVNEKREKQKQ